jgi:hypothetical protein
LILGALWGAGLQSWIEDWTVAIHPYSKSFDDIMSTHNGQEGDLRDSTFVPFIRWKNTADQPIYSPLLVTPTFVVFIASGLMLFGPGGEFWWYEVHEATTGVIAFFGVFVVLWDLLTTGVAAIANRDENQGKQMSSGDLSTIGFMVGVGLLGAIALVLNAPSWVSISAGIAVGAVLSALAVYTNSESLLGKLTAMNDLFWSKIAQWVDDENDYTEIRELLCPKDEMNLTTDLHSIPKNRLTWRLRFRDMKSKICKPMQRT